MYKLEKHVIIVFIINKQLTEVKIMFRENFWLGDNELVVVFRDGNHRVIEKYEDYKVVFTGHFEKCMEYCRNRYISYMESIIG